MSEPAQGGHEKQPLVQTHSPLYRTLVPQRAALSPNAITGACISGDASGFVCISAPHKGCPPESKDNVAVDTGPA